MIRSHDLRTWSDFESVDDCHARAVFVWGNALFIGTQPKGRIYVHNFTTGQSYLFVETEDSAVVAFAEFNGKLYAGTSPAGIVYGFDGTTWREEHRPYGLGVTAMVSDGERLLVFSKGAEGPVAFDGSTWSPFPSAGDGQTVSSARLVNGGIYGGSGVIDPAKAIAGEDARDAAPVSPQFNASSAAIVDGTVAVGGTDNGAILSVSKDGVARMADVGVPVNKIVAVDVSTLMVASGGTVFLVAPVPSDGGGS